MKKRILILLLIVLMLIPHAASANSAARNPWEVRVYLKNVEKGTEVATFLGGDDGEFRLFETRTAKGEKEQSLQIVFREGDTQFYLELTAPDGTVTRSNTADIVLYGKYDYNGEKNLLEDRTSYYNTKSNCATGSLIVLMLLFIFLMPVAVTFLVEWLAALCFGIRPVKYVFAINAITNPLMNLLLVIAGAASGYSSIGYWVTLAVLEIAVVFLEYWFYTRKYAEISRRRLLLFSITANVLSLVLGGLLQYVFM